MQCSDTVTGIVTFPYFHKWSDVNRWIDNVPESFSVYIINPRLLFYGLGTVGLFLTPNYYNGVYIELCNRFIIALTGFPLFLTYSMEESVEAINYLDLELSKKDFINESYHFSNGNGGLLKMLTFWKDNDQVAIPSIDENYRLYLDVQPYFPHDDINFIRVKSDRSFELVHEDTGEVLGEFKEFFLDGSFNVIYTEKGEFKLSDLQLNNLNNGKYDFKLTDSD